MTHVPNCSIADAHYSVSILEKRQALGMDHSHINIKAEYSETLLSHEHGLVELAWSTPNWAYATSLNTNDKTTWWNLANWSAGLFRINVHTHEMEEIKIEHSACVAFFRMSISNQNQHAYLRCYTCCSCGVEGDTGEECGSRDGEVRLTDGSMATGTCGHGCENTKAELGILEVDLVRMHWMADHGNFTCTEDNNCIVKVHDVVGDPHASPRGDLISVLAHGSEGEISAVLKAGENGAPSVKVDAITLGFSGQTSDVMFAENDEHEVAIYSTGYNNFLVVADISGLRASGSQARQVLVGIFVCV